MKNITEYREQAKQNQSKPVAELQVNDFVNLHCSGLKNDCGLKSQVFYTYESSHQTICKVVEIMHVSDKALQDGDYLPTNTGGSCSEDLPDDADMYNLTSEQIDTFYQCVTLVLSDGGRYVFVDRQGYDYCRYMYLWSDFTTMYSKEIEEKQAYIQRMKEERIMEAELKYAAICEKFKQRFPYLKEGDKAPNNIRLLLKKEFPNVKFSVTTRQWGDCIYIHTPKDRINQVKELIRDIESYENRIYATGADGESYARLPFEDLFGRYRTLSVESKTI